MFCKSHFYQINRGIPASLGPKQPPTNVLWRMDFLTLAGLARRQVWAEYGGGGWNLAAMYYP